MRGWPRYSAAMALLLCAGAVRGVGNRTHAEVSERAADRYCMGPQAMVSGLSEFMQHPPNRKALFSGSTFPDWGFGGIEQEGAEQSHWTPFHNVFIEALRERLKTPWTEENAKDVAFFLGDLSHSVADVPWHFDDPANKSFISAARAAEGSSHIDCDTGSDVYLMQRESVVPEIGFGDFYWPEELITEVYRRTGKPLPRALIHTGGVRQQGLWIVMPQVSSVKIADYQARCPWIGANLDGYYYGGIDHNAAAVAIWFKHHFARLTGNFFYQNMPAYGPKPPPWDGYYGCADTVLYPDAPANNSGAEPLLELTAGARSVLKLRFDMPDLPASASITAAVLWLAAEGPLPVVPPLEAAPCPAPWTEGEGLSDLVSGTRGAAADANTATWDSAGLHALAWRHAHATLAAPGWISLDITAWVKAWAVEPALNHGLALRLDPAAATPVRFFSSEAWKSQPGITGGERVAYRPALVITTAR